MKPKGTKLVEEFRFATTGGEEIIADLRTQADHYAKQKMWMSAEMLRGAISLIVALEEALNESDS